MFRINVTVHAAEPPVVARARVALRNVHVLECERACAEREDVRPAKGEVELSGVMAEGILVRADAILPPVGDVAGPLAADAEGDAAVVAGPVPYRSVDDAESGDE
jgi:hypothetical protein